MKKIFKIFFILLIVLFLINGYRYYQNNKPDPSIDRTIPNLIYVKGDTIKIEKGSKINLKDYVKSYDEYDGNLTNDIEIIGEVDTNKAGIYELTYQVKDKSGNEARTKLTIIVEEE